MGVTITTTIPEAVARLNALQARASANAVTLLTEGGQAVKDILKASLYHHTPVDEGEGHSGPHLRDTDAWAVITSRESVQIIGRQLKTVTFKDGTIYSLLRLLTEGHDAPAEPIRPLDPVNGPRALHFFWKGAEYFRASSRGGSAEPDDYVQEAEDEGLPLAIARLRAMAAETTRSALGA